ncbi:uncharacterized protein LOC107268202 [Cephus cinctus]|uniref:Uncharacterized protein LOC107268202 n=1 Tax=Cephus cinctus TaxID=211228 RepID=A0AAJ7BXU2_CEPCN|nr:uncharacterized protein LOC107268202 [Cephus cinctus]
MKFISIVFFIVAALASVYAQDYSQLFAGFGPYLQQSNSGMRDPRSNTGPVLFPAGPPPNDADTSGVIVGASGFGFVPPNSGIYTFYY